MFQRLECSFFFIIEQPKRKRKNLKQAEKNKEEEIREETETDTKTGSSRFILFIGINYRLFSS
jgi:hypothetical protein